MPVVQTFTDSEGRTWDLQGVNPIGSRFPTQTGQGVQGGSADAYDGGLALAVGTDFVNSNGTLVNPSIGSVDENGREVNTSPVIIAGVAITRSMLVSDASISAIGFMRLLDSFTNTTDQPVTILVQMLSDVGSDNSTAIVEETSGNNVIDATDHGFVTDEVSNQTGGDSSVGFVYGDGIGQGASNAGQAFVGGEGIDEITVQFTLTLQPGETQRLLSFAFQNVTAAEGASDLGQFDDALAILDRRGLLSGLSEAERAEIVNYSELAGTGLSVTDGSGQTWRLDTATGSIATVGSLALQATQLGNIGTSLSTFVVTQSTSMSENGQEANLVTSSNDPVLADATVTHSLMASPETGFARYLVTIAAGSTTGFNLTGEPIGLITSSFNINLIGARDIITGGFSTTVEITDSGAVLDDSTSGAGGTNPSLAVVWGDYTMGDAFDGADIVDNTAGSIRAIYDDLNLVAGASASFLYFFATNPDAGSGFGDLAALSTPDFRDLAGLSAAEVASIINFDLDESDRLETVAGFGAGNDSYAGNYWGELIDGAGGNDTLSGAGSDDNLLGGTGNDILDGGTGADNLWGGTGADVHIGGFDAGQDFARYDDANHGNLTIRMDFSSLNTGAAAGDTYVGIEGIIAGAGNDIVVGDAADNIVAGSGGNDMVYGEAGNDRVLGDAGSDNLWGGTGADAHVGGNDAGVDLARYDDANHGNLTIRLDVSSLNTGAAAGDTYSGIEGLVGGAGNDLISGDGSANFLFGGGGADMIFGQAGNDQLFGDAGGDNLSGGAGADAHYGGADAGLDFARYDDANHGNLVISLLTPTTNTGAAAGDTYSSIEGIVAGAGNDVIVGNAGGNFLFGQGAADFIDGREGNDTLNGGAGADDFRFATALGAGNVDTVQDFAVGVDDILLLQSIFTAIGASLTADEFRIGAAVDANDFILYNSSTGALTYDSNGSTAGGTSQFATLTAGLALTVADFVMV